MPLSLSKLEKFLSSKNFFITKKFLENKYCVFVEVINTKTADTFLVYIPSKYDIKSDINLDSYSIKHFSMKDEINVLDNYIDHITNNQQNDYNELNIEVNNAHTDFETGLEENYNRPLSIENASEDVKDLKDIFRQLKRYIPCVQGIKYKLCIIYNKFICNIRKDDTIECYIIKGELPTDQKKKLIISLDLEILYSNLENILSNIKQVKNGIYDILNKNQVKHANKLENMLGEKKQIVLLSNNIYSQKEKYNVYIQKLESMLHKTCMSEQNIIEKIINTTEKYSSHGLKALHNDIEKSHIINKYENELEVINETKQDIIKNILSLREKQDHAMLTIDKIFFDNLVMINNINKNILILENINI